MAAEQLKTDILILGSGGAGLMAALHAFWRDPTLDITVISKGLLGKSGCTRMVQGGYNVALAREDSIERHFMDTIEGGKWLPDQDLAWTLVTVAVERIHELENELGCFFDRNPDGTVHQKAFAGQTFDLFECPVDRQRIEGFAAFKKSFLIAKVANIWTATRDDDRIWNRIEMPFDQVTPRQW